MGGGFRHFLLALAPGFIENFHLLDETADDGELVHAVVPCFGELYDEGHITAFEREVAQAVVPIAAASLREAVRLVDWRAVFTEKGWAAPGPYCANEMYSIRNEFYEVLPQYIAQVPFTGKDFILWVIFGRETYKTEMFEEVLKVLLAKRSGDDCDLVTPLNCAGYCTACWMDAIGVTLPEGFEETMRAANEICQASSIGEVLNEFRGVLRDVTGLLKQVVKCTIPFWGECGLDVAAIAKRVKENALSAVSPVRCTRFFDIDSGRAVS